MKNAFNMTTKRPPQLFSMSLEAKEAMITQVNVTDMAGKLLYVRRVELEKGENQVTMNVSFLKAGQYIVQPQHISTTQTLTISG